MLQPSITITKFNLASLYPFKLVGGWLNRFWNILDKPSKEEPPGDKTMTDSAVNEKIEMMIEILRKLSMKSTRLIEICRSG